MHLSIDNVRVEKLDRTPHANILAIYKRVRVLGHEVSSVVITPDWLFNDTGDGYVRVEYTLDPTKKTLIQIRSDYSAGLQMIGDGVAIIDEPNSGVQPGPLRFSRVVAGVTTLTIAVSIGISYNWHLNDHPESTYDDAHILARIVN